MLFRSMIATHYILGFSKNKDIKISSRHFKLFDTLPSSQAGTLEEDLDKLFVNRDGDF